MSQEESNNNEILKEAELLSILGTAHKDLEKERQDVLKRKVMQRIEHELAKAEVLSEREEKEQKTS